MKASVGKWRRLVERLEQLTLSGSLVWEMSAGVNSYIARLPSFDINIQDKRRENTVDIEVSILGKLGDYIDSFTDEDLSGDDPDGAGWFTRLMQVQETAGRISRGADKALDTVFSELEDLSKK